MKIFRVVTEKDGETTKEQGKTTTELRREELRYAAETMQDVWVAIEWIRNDQEKTLLAIIEEAPAVTVLPPRQNGLPLGRRGGLPPAYRGLRDELRRATR